MVNLWAFSKSAEDPDTYAMLQRGDSVGVFQVESRAQMAMLPRLKPHNFDLVIEVAIVRPPHPRRYGASLPAATAGSGARQPAPGTQSTRAHPGHSYFSGTGD